MNVQTDVQTASKNGGIPVKNRKMSVNLNPQKTAVFGASHGKTRAFVLKGLATRVKTA